MEKNQHCSKQNKNFLNIYNFSLDQLLPFLSNHILDRKLRANLYRDNVYRIF